ncbi:MAG: hypothetical protein IT168_09250 [Bryobacterales bacterium]|nr:hypothetical protein [Bryobacterales bacterium]
MTFRWSTFSSLGGACWAFAGILSAGTVTGTVELIDSNVAAVAKQKDYSGVVVWLERSDGKAVPTAAGTYTILQKNKRFTPHVSVITVGTTVDLPNLDPIFHNAFSNFAGQPFDTGLYPPGGTQRIKFRRPGVVRVFCNIHSTMSAVIVVLDTPYYAKTGREGAYRIDNVEPGEYTLKFWHERAAEDKLKKLERKLVVEGPAVQIPTQQISESGFVQLPHKNKYNREYGPEPASAVPYGGR